MSGQQEKDLLDIQQQMEQSLEEMIDSLHYHVDQLSEELSVSNSMMRELCAKSRTSAPGLQGTLIGIGIVGLFQRAVDESRIELQRVIKLASTFQMGLGMPSESSEEKESSRSNGGSSSHRFELPPDQENCEHEWVKSHIFGSSVRECRCSKCCRYIIYGDYEPLDDTE